MRLEFLGTGGYHPTENRHTACLFVPEAGLVLDAGTGLFRVFPRLMTRELDIFVTHSHLDHIMGLPGCHVPLKLGHLERVRVHGTAETLDAIREHLFALALFPVQTPLEYHELGEATRVSNSGLLTHCFLEHPGGSTAYKVVWSGFSLAYVTDTLASNAYVDFIRDVDLLVHECNFDDEMQEPAKQSGHSYAQAVTTLAKSANVKRLVLTHFDPYADPQFPINLARARMTFPQTELATDFMTIDFQNI
jgi:ribonuclease BN (tRNA processing enzyme)